MRHIISKWWQKRRERYYRGKRWHLAVEIFLLTVVMILLGIVLWLPSYRISVNVDRSTPNGNGQPVVVTPKFDVSLEAIDASVSKNDRLTWKISITNTGSVQIDRIEIQMKEQRLSSWKSDETDVQANKFVIQSLEPQGRTEISASSVCGDCDNLKVISPQADFLAISGASSSSKTFSFPEIRFDSRLSARANAYYYSPQGDQLGIGPVPPVVGVPTTYWLILKAENEGNNISDFTLSFRLPKGVELSGESLLAGKYSYDKENGRLIWQVGDMVASGGSYIANFSLTLTPDDSQVGRSVNLAEDIRFHGSDSWTGSSLSGRIENIDTRLPDDRFNSGSGEVKKE